MASGGCGDDDGIDLIPEPTEMPAAGVPGEIATTSTVTAAGGAASGEVLLFDDFQDGDAAGWEIEAGWYVLGRADRLVLSAGGESWAWWPAGIDWGAGYVLRAAVRFDAGGLAASLAVGAEGRYVVHLHEDGSFLLRDRPWGRFETLAEAPAAAPGVWHALAAGLDGGRLLVFLDGERILEYEDVDPLAGGSVGFGATAGSVVAVDDVLVTLPGRPLPAVVAGPLPGGEGPEPGPVLDPPADDGAEDGDGQGLESTEPDLSIVGVVFDEAIPAAGAPIGVTIRVSNDSTAESDPAGVAWSAGDVGCTAAITGLPPHSETDVPCIAGGLPEGTFDWTAHVDHDEQIAESDEEDNVRTGVIGVVSASPDYPNLGVWSVEFDPEVPGDGEPFGIRVTVADLAPGFAGVIPAHTVRVESGGVVWCSGEADAATAAVSCEHPGLPSGDYQYVVVVDADGDVDEGPGGEVDNTLRGFVHVAGAVVLLEAYDLTIGTVWFDPREPVAGEEFEVRVNVNSRPAPPDFTTEEYIVRWRIAGELACEWGVTSAPSSSFCTWRVDAPGTYRWEAIVDPTDTVEEAAAEGNNTESGTVTVIP